MDYPGIATMNTHESESLGRIVAHHIETTQDSFEVELSHLDSLGLSVPSLEFADWLDRHHLKFQRKTAEFVILTGQRYSENR